MIGRLRVLHHLALGLVIVIICQVISGITSGLTDSINSDRPDRAQVTLESEQESCSQPEIEIQPQSIYKMPKARGIKQIATAHMQREG